MANLLRCLLGFACLLGGVLVQAADDFLAPEQAFKLAAQSLASGQLELQFEVAGGYYLYREQFKFSVGGRELAAALPKGQRKFDETFQKEVETYRDRVAVRLVGVDQMQTLEVTGQGCADKGLCYAPMTVRLARQSDGSWSMAPISAEAPMFGLALWQATAAPTVSAQDTSTPVAPWKLGAVLSMALVGTALVMRDRLGRVSATRSGWLSALGLVGVALLGSAALLAWMIFRTV